MNLTFILKVLNIVSSGRWGGGGEQPGPAGGWGC